MNWNYLRRVWGVILVGCICFSMTCTNQSVAAFDGPTHKYVTEKSLEIFLNLKESYKDFYNEKAVEEIVKYCTKPDEDENDGLFKDHFYNIATERNFMGEKVSALMKFKHHYNQALVDYKTGRAFKSWEELGRSIHFLEDLITPVHSGYDCPLDAINKLSMHVDFEKKCIEVQDNCLVVLDENDIRYFVDNPLEEIGKMCSRQANDNFFSLEKGYLSDETIAYYSIKDAQKVVSGILYRFYTELQNS